MIRLSKLFTHFFESEKAGGFILIGCTVVSLLLANLPTSDFYVNLWETSFANHSITHWINDGLMTIFFLLIGLELEREIYKGELSNIKNALLPIFGALGGMLVPAGIFLLLNFGTVTQSGAGIPMATDIAFAIGILSLLGNRVPTSLKVFLTALAVIDDLGAILVIAIFYSKGIMLLNLGIALGVLAVLFVLNRMKVHIILPYIIGGIIMWYFMLESGVHATITGVLLAFVIPFGNGGPGTSSYRIQHFLHRPVSFFIMPLFALANTAIVINEGWEDNLFSLASVGIFLGLVIGKPLGIFLFSYFAVKIKLCELPADSKWRYILGAGMLAGIGFTMSIFITLLAFNDSEHITSGKIAILIASATAAILGLVFLKAVFRPANPAKVEPVHSSEGS
jgi:NhaA family Na+:H+ antiporter